MPISAVLGLEHVAGAGEHQRDLAVGHRHHRLQPAQIAVGAPVLGELDAGAGQLAGVALQLGFQPLQQGEGVGGAAGEAGDDVAAAELAHLLGVGLDHGLAEADLAVAGHGHLGALADGEDGRAVPGCRLCHGTLARQTRPARRAVQKPRMWGQPHRVIKARPELYRGSGASRWRRMWAAPPPRSRSAGRRGLRLRDSPRRPPARRR